MEFEVRGGSFGYPGENEILKNISFTAGPGSAVTILGPNGAGKTTLLRCILGFLPWSSGQTLLDGKDLQQIPSSELSRGRGGPRCMSMPLVRDRI